MTEPAYLSATRAAYDKVAADYHELLRKSLARMPYDRAMLGVFAEHVRAADVGPVADVGCGPGRITAYLDSLGVPVSGIDLSPEMIAVARRTYPALRFEVGSMSTLDLKDGELGGVVAYYSIIHTPPELLPPVFAEFARVLAPGGHLLLAFQVGDQPRHITSAYGHDGLDYNAYRLQPDHITALAADAGLQTVSRLVREPEGEYESSPQAYLIIRKPDVA
ncbi:class I SAM-dependent DNA methyltransferase [Amycolatopsis sp. NPDC059021]|uniref:class I SAM-dependent DNA methyltransferase n=1 Tax=Amycolatopsis sp. NPDC059021 TaxID=3346704 RepID=UPI00366FE502